MNETSASCVICWRSGHVTSMMQLITGPSALSMVARFGAGARAASGRGYPAEPREFIHIQAYTGLFPRVQRLYTKCTGPAKRRAIPRSLSLHRDGPPTSPGRSPALLRRAVVHIGVDRASLGQTHTCGRHAPLSRADELKT